MVDKSYADMCLHDMIVSLHHKQPHNVKQYATLLLEYLNDKDNETPPLKRLAAIDREELMELLRYIVY